MRSFIWYLSTKTHRPADRLSAYTNVPQVPSTVATEPKPYGEGRRLIMFPSVSPSLCLYLRFVDTFFSLFVLHLNSRHLSCECVLRASYVKGNGQTNAATKAAIIPYGHTPHKVAIAKWLVGWLVGMVLVRFRRLLRWW